MAQKSDPYCTRFRMEVANQIEEWRDRREEQTGEPVGKGQALNDLTQIGIQSELGEGTPTERELRRDVEELEREVERVEKEKQELRTYAIIGGAAAAGVFVVVASIAGGDYFMPTNLSRDLAFLGMVIAMIASLAFILTPLINHLVGVYRDWQNPSIPDTGAVETKG